MRKGDKVLVFKNSCSCDYVGKIGTITKINETHVSIHDSGGTPNLTVEKEQFIKAWKAPATDRDTIIIKGKL